MSHPVKDDDDGHESLYERKLETDWLRSAMVSLLDFVEGEFPTEINDCGVQKGDHCECEMCWRNDGIRGCIAKVQEIKESI